MIYVIANPTIKVVKIGWCAIDEFDKFRVARRLSGIQVGSPHKLYLLAYWAGGRTDEHLLHSEFKDRQLHGEWFDWCEILEQKIIENTSNANSYVFKDIHDFMRGVSMPMQAGAIQITDEEVVRQIESNPLFKFRKQNGWALRIVAAKLGCSQTTVSKWEDGSSYPMDENMIKLAGLMKLSFDDLAKLWREWYQLSYKKDDQTNGDKETTSKEN